MAEATKHNDVALEIMKIKGIGPCMATQLIGIIGDISKFDNISKLWAYAGFHVIERCRKCDKRIFTNKVAEAEWLDKMVLRLKRIAEKRKEKTRLNEDDARDRLRKQLCDCEAPEIYRCAPKRKRGELCEWNPKLRMICWKIAGQFLRARAFYYHRYLHYKHIYEEREAFKTQAKKAKGVKGHIHNMALRRIAKEFLADVWVRWRELMMLPVTKPYSARFSQNSPEIHQRGASQKRIENPKAKMRARC